ncbi:MAG: copper transporter [Coriobacteriales bacterium]|jgi:hypothetical protein|nr:copper transporter [Coriobacteriales bacterium]
MYNFRYHLVTIVSIFAALALGLLLGVALTGSDLVRDASNNLAESLTKQFDELNSTNEALSRQLGAEEQFSRELLAGWRLGRLEDRAIVIVTRTPEQSDALSTEMSELIRESGGVPIVVRINAARGVIPDDEASLAELKALVREVDGENYEVTVARALADEWTFTLRAEALSPPDESDIFVPDDGTLATPEEPEPPAIGILEGRYKLTDWLVREGRINVTVSYRSLIEALDSLNTTTVAEAATITAQHTAYDFVAQRQFPYAVNGLIDTAVVAAAGSDQLLADPVALQLALAFEDKGREGELPYLHALIGKPAANSANGANGANGTAGKSSSPAAAQVSPDANYYTLLVQQDVAANTMLDASREAGLSCILSPFTPTGSYGVVALLSGAPKGAYGLDRPNLSALPLAPTDPQGDAPFKPS